tara:strand:+ start:682 stop:1977 length:1296 start_codon:yes stop_codon:yes gene_type:complete
VFDLLGLERALVLHPYDKKKGNGLRLPEECLGEAVGLAQAIKLDVVFSDIQSINRIRPATFFGLGSVKTYKHLIERECISIVFIDTPLTPIQQRNLEIQWSCKVVDRTGLILEIFGKRARTREGKLQVELAHLSYQRSRLVRSWTHLERQRGGFGFLGGPGETQIESDRRQIDTRISRLKKELSKVTQTRSLHRRARNKIPFPVVALVGYTNAGKSTLFNLLSGAKVEAVDQLFATLDPTMRAITLPASRKKIILSDTVGFVSSLPTTLVASFKATLEEVLEADLILHVRDISHSDSKAQKEDVFAVLGELGVAEGRLKSIVEVKNKIDLICEKQKVKINHIDKESIYISAKTGEGCDDLLELIENKLNLFQDVIELKLSVAEGDIIAWLYRNGEIISREDSEEEIFLRVGLQSANLGRFYQRFPKYGKIK